MGAKFYFLDNDEYTAQDMNNVLSTLTTQGVSLYKQSGTALMDYEEAIKNLVEPGVDIYNTDACKIVKADDGNYYASAGTCWLPDGSCMVIDDEKLAVENYTAGQLNYVYARHDRVANRIFVGASTEKITEYAVKLAEIDAEGNVSDMRVFAVAKIAVPTANIVIEKNVHFVFPAPHKDTVSHNYLEVETGYAGWHRVYFYRPDERYGHSGDLVDGPFNISNGEWRSVNGTTLGNAEFVYARKSGSKLELDLTQKDYHGIGSAYDVTIRFY